MNEVSKFVKQSSHYLGAQILISAAGIVSFPILTRILSVDDYGLLGLIGTSMFIVQAIARLGGPNAIVRYLPEYSKPNKVVEFYSTALVGYGLASLSIIGILGTVLIYAAGSWIGDNAEEMGLVVLGVMFANCTNSIVMSCLRAEQRSRAYNIVALAARYGTLSASIGVLCFLRNDLLGYYSGQLSVLGILCVTLTWWFTTANSVSVRQFRGRLFARMVKYGSPLTISEMGHLLLSYADRYVIQYILGTRWLGVYTAGYNLCTYATEMLMYPVNAALDPIYLKLYSEKGEAETSEFLGIALRYFVLILCPVVAIFNAVGGDLIEVMASTKYREAEVIFKYVVLGNAIYACQVILNAGLVISKKTHVIMFVKLGVCVVNLMLNFVLIPRMGIAGAAQATLYSYIGYVSIISWLASRELKIKIYYGWIACYIMSGLLSFYLAEGFEIGNRWLNIVSQGSLILSFFAIVTLVIDRELRRHLVGFGARIREGWGRMSLRS